MLSWERDRIAATAAGALLAAALIVGGSSAARAEFKVRSPIVEYGELEIEHNGAVSFDKSKSGLNNQQNYNYEIEYGVTPWWKLELDGEWEAEDRGENLRYHATEVESVFQLTEQGKYWADLGFFAAYEHAAISDSADKIEFGPIVQKELRGILGTDTLHTLNLFVEKEIGHSRSDDTELSIAWQSRFLLNQYFEPGIEYFGKIDDIESPGKAADQEHRLGPMFAGGLDFGRFGELKYEIGYLFGLTRSTPDGTVRWRLEYGIEF